MIQLQIFKECTIRIPRTKIQNLFRTIYKKETDRNFQGGVNLVFTDDKRLKELNGQFRNKNIATDVLSFNLDEPDNDDAIFGEVYISVQTAQRQAKEYKAPISEEIIRLCCHGFLHLLGYDHIDPQDAEVMQEKENRFLKKVYS